MILQLAHFLADEHRRGLGRNCRSARPGADVAQWPQAGAAHRPRSRSGQRAALSLHRPWIKPLTEPLRQNHGPVRSSSGSSTLSCRRCRKSLPKRTVSRQRFPIASRRPTDLQGVPQCVSSAAASRQLLALRHLGQPGLRPRRHDHPPVKVQPAEAYEPTVLPDRIILTWAGDPATTQAVTWRTSTEVKKALAEIAVADGGPGFPKTARQLPAASQALKTDLSRPTIHAVKFEELSAVDQVCLSRRRRRELERVVPLHDRQRQARAAFRSSTSATPRTTSARSGRG